MSFTGNRFATLPLSLALAMVGACGGEPSAPEDVSSVEDVAVETIDASSTDSAESLEVIEIDLTRADRVYAFDPAAGPIDYSRVLLICPDGTRMSMSVWLDERSHELGLDITAAGAGSLALGLPQTWHSVVSALPPVDPGNADCGGCADCPDGAYVCYDLSCFWQQCDESALENECTTAKWSDIGSEGYNSGSPVPGPHY